MVEKTKTIKNQKYRYIGRISNETMPYVYGTYNRKGYSVKSESAGRRDRNVYVSVTKQSKRRK